MAGAYNHNVQKMTEDFMEEYRASQAVCPWYGRASVFRKRDVDMDGGFLIPCRNRLCTERALSRRRSYGHFLKESWMKVRIVYTQMLSAMAMEAGEYAASSTEKG